MYAKYYIKRPDMLSHEWSLLKRPILLLLYNMLKVICKWLKLWLQSHIYAIKNVFFYRNECVCFFHNLLFGYVYIFIFYIFLLMYHIRKVGSQWYPLYQCRQSEMTDPNSLWSTCDVIMHIFTITHVWRRTVLLWHILSCLPIVKNP